MILYQFLQNGKDVEKHSLHSDILLYKYPQVTLLLTKKGNSCIMDVEITLAPTNKFTTTLVLP